MYYTQNPELDASDFSDNEEAISSYYDMCRVCAPGIVLAKLIELKTAEDWIAPKFALAFSASSILHDAMIDGDVEVLARHSEFVMTMTEEARHRLFQAMANWFSSVWAYEIFSESLDSLSGE